MWEVDFAFMPAGHDRNADGSPKPDLEWWQTIPIGTVSYVGPIDFPIAEHYARARASVAAGSQFAVIGDLAAGDLKIFRRDGMTCETEDVRIPEMPWFDVPVRGLR
jgi:hypothetical protein